ncbi:ureidoglycolate lyase [Rhizobium petrolearium]|uniref:ureidoglycolate lyase n=1 Tax=Neorhizobium petrolearium TaxID=515361 RepID=UPI001AE986AD|nr:ureidoglycolate lyase [Neorhizobium petrolearium]MBP1845443.1 ureidoglycolate lyase [Neorhizobium petrolearium]
MTEYLEIHPLTKDAFAPFGDVIEPDPATLKMINNGTTERYHALATPVVSGEGSHVVISLFRAQPRQFPYAITMMERHPLGSQSFSPLSGKPFLLAVSEDVEGRPGMPKVFLAKAGQGINYGINIWHHPLMALGAVSDFLVADRDGPGNNLEEFFFDTPFLIAEPSL